MAASKTNGGDGAQVPLGHCAEHATAQREYAGQFAGVLPGHRDGLHRHMMPCNVGICRNDDRLLPADVSGGR